MTVLSEVDSSTEASVWKGEDGEKELIKKSTLEDLASVEVRIVSTMKNREFVNSFTDGAQDFFKMIQEAKES